MSHLLFCYTVTGVSEPRYILLALSAGSAAATNDDKQGDLFYSAGPFRNLGWSEDFKQ